MLKSKNSTIMSDINQVDLVNNDNFDMVYYEEEDSLSMMENLSMNLSMNLSNPGEEESWDATIDS